MAYLVLLRDEKPALRCRIDKRELTVGRGNDVDLHIPDVRISRLHFIVCRKNDTYILYDRSMNGTYVNGVRSRACPLQDGDLISVGGAQVRFEEKDIVEPPSTVYAPKEGGMIAYNQRQKTLLYSRPVLFVRDAERHEARIVLSGERIRIGSDPSNDIVVVGSAPRHCELRLVDEGYILHPLHDDVPVFLEGAAIDRPVSLPFDVTVGIGGAQFALELEEGEESLEPMPVDYFEGMVGRGEKMQHLFTLIDRFSRHDAPVIILGETGTGKELVARALHQRGPRSKGPFIAINCSAISQELFESELFGHEKGAFTGALRDRIGAMEAANGGVLFLDEIGDLPLSLQPKLLRALETSTVTPVGSYTPRSVDVRIIAATHKNLERLVSKKRFRADLFYRLFVLSLEIPPLRERMEDLPILVQHFLRDGSPSGKTIEVRADAMQRLESHKWPGNVRELRHVLTRAMACGADHELVASDILFSTTAAPERTPDRFFGGGQVMKLEEMERMAIEDALRIHHNNRSEAAKALGIARSTLHHRMKKYKLEDSIRGRVDG